MQIEIPSMARRPARRPDEDERREHERAGKVAEPPGAEDTAELVRLDHVAEPERDDTEDGADQRSEGSARDEGEDVPDPLERYSLLRQSAE